MSVSGKFEVRAGRAMACH